MAHYQPSPYEQYLALREGARANPIVISSDDESSDDGGVNDPHEETTTDSGSTSDTESEGHGHDSTQANDGEGCSREPPHDIVIQRCRNRQNRSWKEGSWI